MELHVENDRDLNLLIGMQACVASLEAADEVGLLAAIGEAPRSAADLAAALGIDASAALRVLDVLEAYQIVARSAAGFSCGERLAALRRSPMVQFRFARLLWSHVPRFLATGASFHPFGEDARVRAPAFAPVVEQLGRMFEAHAAELAELATQRMPCELGRAIRVLDVGAGSAVWSLAMAEKDPGVEVTVLDLPAVVSVARKSAETRGLAGRVTVIEGDYASVAIPEERFDRVVAANILHLETPERARTLVARLARALAPGGRLVIVDAFCDGSLASRRAWTAYALNLAARTGTGFPHRVRELEGWAREAGLELPELWMLSSGRPWGCLVARRGE